MDAAKGILRGIGFAVWGVVSALQNPRLMKDYTQFAKSMGVVLLALYSAAIVLLFFALPIVVFVPGLALQLLALIPYWAISITKSRSPVSTNLLFFDEVREVNPSLYRELKDASSATKGRAWVSGVKDDVHRSWHFTRYSLLLLAFSIVPVVGPIVSFFGQIVLVTNRLGWNLLSVYTQDCRKMNYRQQKDWMRTYRWLIFGFTLPFAVLTSVPFVGPLLMGLAEGASVHLVAHIVSRDPGHRTWRDHHKREKRADAQEEVIPALSASGLSARDGTTTRDTTALSRS